MLIKEYRIPLPLTVEEYRIAQLYMIAAWNAYPYTKTRYTCPFVEKFSLEIETYYFPDKGHQDNVFKLSGADLRNRIVDLIDIVKDQLYGADYTREEDPTVYCSERTGRGPLSDCWLDEHWEEVQGKQQPTARNMSLMCAYKLCRVEFRYWGMQTKLEKFIHDTALRKTMLRAHRQAWAWQDEWYGLSMDDIREIERQTQLALQRKMGNEEGGNEQDGEGEEGEGTKAAAEQDNRSANQIYSIEKTNENSTPHMEKKEAIPIITTTAEADHGGPGAGRPYRKEKPKPSAPSSEEDDTPEGKQQQRRREEDDEEEDEDEDDEDEEEDERHGGSRGQSQQGAACYLRKQNNTGSKSKLHSPLGSAHSFDLQVANWRMEKLEVDSKSGSEEEFFDCLGR
uniref:Phosphatidylinositol transfer protein N-terminal domain-containing protein n=1 Tax=Anopheles coluzzii TaxID=1518534 RepID=A0A8W7PQH2_ANOCL